MYGRQAISRRVISKSTVSRALSDTESRISEATKEKVRECAKRHGFKPNIVAKALARKKTFNIAVVVPFEATSPQVLFFHECLSGIITKASNFSYSVLVCMTSRNNIGILEDAVENRKVDSVILTQPRHDDDSLRLLKRSGLPFVVIGSGSEKKAVYVDSRMKENCSEFTKLCLKNLAKGASVLFVCGSLDVEANNNRLSGFLSGMEDSGIDSLQYAVCTDTSDIAGEISLKSWSLVLCSDDVVCLQVLEILHEKQIAVGTSVKVASFHDSVLLESHLPAISALKVDAFSLGEKSAELALSLISGRKCENINYVDCSFQMRTSTE